jgi:hypothetical protein
MMEQRAAYRPREPRVRERSTRLSGAERTRRRYNQLTSACCSLASRRQRAAPSFYYANSNLYNATREAFQAAIPALRKQPDFLKAFKRLGCYVEDLCEQPVNDLDRRDPRRL